MLVSLNWLRDYIDFDISDKVVADKITMGGVEVEEIINSGDDSILNLAPTPNRGDCLSIIGVARELAALLGKEVKYPKTSIPKGKEKMRNWVDIKVEDKKACPRYTSRIVDGVKIGPSPDWLRDRVESAGIRSINNVVDATNYVLIKWGQPTHAFDLRFLKGSKLIIGHASKPCKIMTLDEEEREFTTDDILNLDAERPIGAAGIMGGENSGVTDDTTTLVLESAYFDPTTVRRTSKRTGLISESSRRFEKGVDPEGVINALHRLTSIILDVAGGVPSDDWVDFYPVPIRPARLELTTSQVNWLLGTDIDSKSVIDILKSIGCEIISKKVKDKVEVKVPLYRPDITRPVDLIEEVARLYGYDKIKDHMPNVMIRSIVKPPAKEAEREAKEALISQGFYEALTYSFSSENDLRLFSSGGAVELANPLTVDMVYMRKSLIPPLLKSLKNNQSRQINDVKLFEIGKVFLPMNKDLPGEELHLAGVMAGNSRPGQWDGSGKDVDLFDAKAAIWSVFDRLGISSPDIGNVDGKAFLHPSDSFDINYDGKNIGFCGRLHPSIEKEYDFSCPVYIYEVNFDSIKEAYLKRSISYKPFSKYPSVERDVALLVDMVVTHKEMLQSFKKYVNNIVQRIELFDIYIGKGIPKGKKSMAYRVYLGSDERTLSDTEVENTFNGIIGGVTKDINAVIR